MSYGRAAGTSNSLRPYSFELFGRTVGYVGMGRIGREAAVRFKSFGTKGFYYDPYMVLSPEREKELGLQWVEFDELLVKSDIITLHVPSSDATHHLIDASALARMKPTAIVINTSRGTLIDEAALISLRADNGAFGTVGGNFCAAGFSPPPADRLELIGEKASILFENYILHLRGDSEETIRFDFEKAYQQSYDNAIAHFVQGLAQDAPFETDGFDNLQTLKLVEDAYRLAGWASQRLKF